MKETEIFRTRFAGEIVAEISIPKRQRGKIALFAPGVPSSASKKELQVYFTDKGFTSIFLRYRGTWESGGNFLERSPHEDILDIIHEISRKKKILHLEKGEWCSVKVKDFYLFATSFGGPAALFASLDPRVKKGVALSPVIDWRISGPDEPFPWWQKYMETAFGGAYRSKKADWRKLSRGNFYNPLSLASKIDGKKILIFHAKDDRVVPFEPARDFSKMSGSHFILKQAGGHLSSRILMYKRNWRIIEKFLKNS